jgi:alpha-2-macroglobulin
LSIQTANPLTITLRKTTAVLCLGLLGLSMAPLRAEQDEPSDESIGIQNSGQGTLHYQLSSGSQSTKGLPVTKATTLLETEVQRLLQRVPAIKVAKGDKKTFQLAERSLPAPRSAETQKLPFPNVAADSPKPIVQPTELKVTGIAPQGTVGMAPHLTVSFNQPMVPLTTLAQLEAKDLPVNLTPTPPGKWRWLGTQTLMFVPDKRFPMATKYSVDVPVGTKSALGQRLTKAEHAEFVTPSLQLTSTMPTGGSQPLDPLIFLGFNQDIDASTLARTIKVSNDGQSVPFSLAGSDVLARHKSMRNSVESFGKKRCLVLKLSQELKPSSTCQVTVSAGSPSQEGPLLTAADQSFSFSTYQALAVQGHSESVQPGQPLSIWFNNTLDPSKCKLDEIRVTPPLKKQAIKINGGSLMIYGQSKARSEVQVEIPASMTDTYGQRLGKSQTLSFKVGAVSQRFSGPNQGFVVLDPQGPRQLPFSVVNVNHVHLRAWRVEPKDWPAYLTYAVERRRNDKNAKPPGTQVLDTDVDTNCPLDEAAEFNLDLAKGLKNGFGQLMVEVIATDYNTPNDQPKPRYIGWIQSTHIGLDAMADSQQLLCSASDLLTGKGLAGVSVRVEGTKGESRTGSDGLAKLGWSGQGPLLVAQKGDDVAILPRQYSYYYGGGNWAPNSPHDQDLWHVLDDRQLYRPSEKVSIKGWTRHSNYGPKGDIVATKATSISYELKDSRGNSVLKGSAPVAALGAFNLQLDLPKNMNLGRANLYIKSNEGAATNHSFDVQEFRRPEFEVSTTAAKGSCVVGENGFVTTSASYFAGGNLANAKVDWSVSSSSTSYSPPNWASYTFGSWTPWWNCRCWWNEGPNGDSGEPTKSYSSQTDANGKSTLQLNFQSLDKPRPQSVSAQATVQDVNRQAFSSSASLLVHPSAYYVGLKSDRVFVEKGQPLEMSCIVTDLDGNVIKGRPVQITAFRWEWEAGEIKKVDLTKQVVTTVAGPTKFSLPTTEGGTYQIEAEIQDQQNRQNQSQINVWVAGGKVPPSQTVEQESITLVPSKKEYEPTDTAEILVQVPFPQADLTVTTRRNGLASVQHLNCVDGTAKIKIPLEELYIPNLQVQVDAVGPKVRTDVAGKELQGKPLRPAYASGNLSLAISKKTREVTVKVTPAATKLQPGESTEVEVLLKDWQGKPVSGEVTLVMVDESVLALTGYSFADPLSRFCIGRSADVFDAHLRQYLMLNRVDAVTDETPEEANLDENESSRDRLNIPMPCAAPAPMQLQTKKPMMFFATGKTASNGAPAAKPIRVRTNFTPLAVFEPSLRTNSQGRVKTKIKLPDNLTRYRIVALAASGEKQFGKGESSLTARQPLMVRPSAPRFLNFGDAFELPVVLQNQTDQPMKVDLACRATNAKVQGHNQGGLKVVVPANDRVEVRLPSSTEQAGTARFQFAASSGSFADAAEISLPVYTPATTEAFATYGVIDEGAIQQPLEAPKNAIAGFGNLNLTTSSTALSELTDAFLYLYAYPFECSEQVSSRMLSAAALKDVLEAFQAPGMPSKTELETAFTRDLKRLEGTQNSDGGWDYWERGRPSLPYLSVHVAHALVFSKAKGFKVDESMLARALGYLKSIESHIPTNYSSGCRRSIRSYAIYVLNLAGQPQTAKARQLAAEVKSDGLLAEAIGWILPTLAKDPSSKSQVDELLRYLDSKVTQTAAHANFFSSYKDQDYLLLASDYRDDAVLLQALVEVKSDSPLLPKLVRGLLDHRTKGHWSNTQENCWVLIALDKYFHKFEAATPDFVARMWLGDKLATEQQFKGRNKNENRVEVPLDKLDKTLTLQKDGTGRLYYRLGMTYAPTDLKLAAADYGFVVSRNYEALGDNRDVRRDKDGTWHIKAGSEVKVTVGMQVPSRRYHVALVDPLPAGFEPLNPALRGSGNQARTKGSHSEWWWSYQWFEHQNMRDERVEAFTQQLWGGVYTYTYTARATTPGHFVVPPAKAEEMYHPETFGRSATDRVKVE